MFSVSHVYQLIWDAYAKINNNFGSDKQSISLIPPQPHFGTCLRA